MQTKSMNQETNNISIKGATMIKKMKTADEIYAEKAIHSVVEKKVDPVLFDDKYTTEQSKKMEKCPMCNGHENLKLSCTMCDGKGMVQCKALNSTVKPFEDIKPNENPLWIAITGFLRMPNKATEERLINLIKSKTSEKITQRSGNENRTGKKS